MHPKLKRAAQQAISFLLLAAVLIAVAVLKDCQQRPLSTTTTLNGWSILEGCTLQNDRANDGDSFRVRHGSQEFVVRLYFADCPEKNAHDYNRTRMEEQGRDFGGASIEDMARVGAMARERTQALLDKPFRVSTKWERVFDSERVYGFVECEIMSGKFEDLAAILVREGLARVHTKGCDHPNGSREKIIRSDLRLDSSRAEKARLGAWAR